MSDEFYLVVEILTTVAAVAAIYFQIRSNRAARRLWRQLGPLIVLTNVEQELENAGKLLGEGDKPGADRAVTAAIGLVTAFQPQTPEQRETMDALHADLRALTPLDAQALERIAALRTRARTLAANHRGSPLPSS